MSEMKSPEIPNNAVTEPKERSNIAATCDTGMCGRSQITDAGNDCVAPEEETMPKRARLDEPLVPKDSTCSTNRSYGTLDERLRSEDTPPTDREAVETTLDKKNVETSTFSESCGLVQGSASSFKHCVESVSESRVGSATEPTRQDYRLLAHAGNVFQDSAEHFLKGCKWSPDGTCLLTSSGDACMRVFDVSSDLFVAGDTTQLMPERVKVPVHELIYDFCWYPRMDQRLPASCCFATTSRDHPIHLWDSSSGELKSTYRAFDHLDELVSAYSLAFSVGGDKLYCGFNKTIRMFDVERPGRNCIARSTFDKQGQPGIISCLAVSSAQPNIYAAGSYSKVVALYGEPGGEMMYMFQGQRGGVTHLQFSPDGTKLYSGGRMDPEILCWDLRNPGNILFTLQRQVKTNQRIYFDQDRTGQYIMSGNQNGTVSVWDTLGSVRNDQTLGEAILDPAFTIAAHSDTANSVSCHPTSMLLATGSGQRHFSLSHQGRAGSVDSDSSDSDGDSRTSKTYDNSLKLWLLDL